MVLLRRRLRDTGFADDHGAVAMYGCTAIHQSIVLGDVGVGMNGDRRNFEVLIHGSMVSVSMSWSSQQNCTRALGKRWWSWRGT